RGDRRLPPRGLRGRRPWGPLGGSAPVRGRRGVVLRGTVSGIRRETMKPDMIKPKTAYLLLCVAGVLLPYSQFLPFLREHGLDMKLFVEQLFSTRIGAFFGMDIVVSALVLWLLCL